MTFTQNIVYRPIVGFKGGEVPLFFYWRHIRKRLILIVPYLLRFWQEWDLWPFFLSHSQRLFVPIMGMELLE
jgi:hypothetical protein